MSFSRFGGPSLSRSTRGFACTDEGGGAGFAGAGAATTAGSPRGVGVNTPQPDSAAPTHAHRANATRLDRVRSHHIALDCGERARVQVFRTRERHWLREWAHADRRFYSVSLDRRAVGYAWPQNAHTTGD